MAINSIPKTAKFAARFWAKVSISNPNDCWVWIGCKDSDKYGTFWVDSKRRAARAHRIAWEIINGHVPIGLQVLHDCPGGDNPSCCNPNHLWVGTNYQNIQDRSAKGRSAFGLRNGAYTCPEKRPRGDKNGFRLHPEKKLFGDKNPSRAKPEFLARGDRNGSRLHPEKLTRGEKHHSSKLKIDQVIEIKIRMLNGERKCNLAREFGITPESLRAIEIGRSYSYVKIPDR